MPSFAPSAVHRPANSTRADPFLARHGGKAGHRGPFAPGRGWYSHEIWNRFAGKMVVRPSRNGALMGFNRLQWVYSGFNGIDDVKTGDHEKYNGAKPSRHDDLRGETRDLMGYSTGI